MRMGLFFLCFLLSSCSTTSGISRDFKLNPSGTDGLVVGTITYSSFTGSYSVGWSSPDGKAAFWASVGFANWPPLGPEFDDDLGAKGGTFATIVPAGTYTIGRWRIQQGMTIYAPSSPMAIPFTVDAGKVTYIGSFHFDKSDVVSLEDRSSRDLPILRSRYQAVSASPLAFSIAPGTKIESLGGEMNKSFMTPFIFVPVVR